MSETFRLGFKGRLKHGILLEALERLGMTQADAARALGVEQTVFGKWINLRDYPRKLTSKQTKTLLEWTGKLPEELWPEMVRSKDFLAQPKQFSITHDVSAKALTGGIGWLGLPPATPDEVFDRQELRHELQAAIDTLPPRIAYVMRQRFWTDKTLEQIGNEMPGRPVTRTRVRQLEARGLRLLRHPSRSRKLTIFDKDR